ncbi:MAG: hypothetical protein JW801_08200 [Bacteroidales bacterium]|nr:hypothetical protein [Bacteroidales bacterium]
MRIIADYREAASSVPDRLKELGVEVELKSLDIADYIVNGELLVERKTSRDFVVSLIQGRLFSQCGRMKRSQKQAVILIEGDPYQSGHAIDPQAVRGAILSISVCWQIPVIFSADKLDTANLLIMAGHQRIKEQHSQAVNYRSSYKPGGRDVHFLQGLPGVGPVLAGALLERFDSIENVILASEEEMLEIEGLGKTKIRRIRKFLSKGLK